MAKNPIGGDAGVMESKYPIHMIERVYKALEKKLYNESYDVSVSPQKSFHLMSYFKRLSFKRAAFLSAFFANFCLSPVFIILYSRLDPLAQLSQGLGTFVWAILISCLIFFISLPIFYSYLWCLFPKSYRDWYWAERSRPSPTVERMDEVMENETLVAIRSQLPKTSDEAREKRRLEWNAFKTSEVERSNKAK
ncbi:MAG: hypothetical protein EOP06_02305 [Proteobacteria bacterium]|nr:MAG: hypothetical protein EOP06_02305 [Pseudomonadota bacterium]